MFSSPIDLIKPWLAIAFHYLASVHSTLQREALFSKLTVIDRRTGRQFDIPIEHDAIPAMYFQRAGLKVLDPGFANTAIMKSQITFIDGNRGTIRYRQHSINDLFGRNDWAEVAHLLIWGSLPTQQQKQSFESALVKAMRPHQLVIEAIQRLPPNAPALSMVLAGLAAYTAAHPGSIPTASGNPNLYLGQIETVDRATIDTIACMASIVGLIYCHQHGKEFTQPDPNRPFISNMLFMMGFVDEATGAPCPKVVRTLERLWVLYADHEMTNSTAAFLHVASSLADPISCCTAYVASGNGPLHGGAIDLAYKTFERVGTPSEVPAMIANVKAKKHRLFGYGHRIYKTVDPRTQFIKSMMDEFPAETKADPLLAVAMEIDKIASNDRYFTSRNLKANADLYGCFVYTAMGFEKDIIAPLAMLSRIPGVMAHWREAMSQPPRLWRPQQVFVEPDQTIIHTTPASTTMGAAC